MVVRSTTLHAICCSGYCDAVKPGCSCVRVRVSQIYPVARSLALWQAKRKPKPKDKGSKDARIGGSNRAAAQDRPTSLAKARKKAQFAQSARQLTGMAAQRPSSQIVKTADSNIFSARSVEGLDVSERLRRALAGKARCLPRSAPRSMFSPDLLRTLMRSSACFRLLFCRGP